MITLGAMTVLACAVLVSSYTVSKLSKENTKLKDKSTSQSVAIKALTQGNESLIESRDLIEIERKNLNDKLYQSNQDKEELELKLQQEKDRSKLEIEKAKREKSANVSSRGTSPSSLPSSNNNSKANAPTSNVKATSDTTKGNWITMQASSYTDSPSENGGYSTTKMGTALRYGIVAVDPNFIPLGTKIKIDQFPNMIFSCEDIGSAIRGSRIDILLNSKSEAMKFGRRSVKIQIVK